MKALRNGITLVEILVSLVILGIVVSFAMFEFLAQDRSWKTESDKAAVGMMAKGTLDELSHAARLTGGGLPWDVGGIKVWGHGLARVTFVSNENGWVDTVRGAGIYDPGSRSLAIAVDSARNFPDLGYVLLDVMVPANSTSTSPTDLHTYLLGIRKRLSGGACAKDSLVLMADTFYNYGWTTPSALIVSNNTLVYRLDSVTYHKANDTLYVRRNRQPEPGIVYALGVDTLNLTYRHPGNPDTLWLDSLSPAAPANVIDQVRIHLVTRSLQPDPKLRQQDSASRGYHFSTLETEVTLRNDHLLNR